MNEKAKIEGGKIPFDADNEPFFLENCFPELEEEDDSVDATNQQIIDAIEKNISDLEKCDLDDQAIDTLKRATILILKLLSVEFNNRLEDTGIPEYIL